MLFLQLTPLLMGIALGIQTAINGRLKSFLTSSLLTSLFSFSSGALFLAVLMLVENVAFGFSPQLFLTEPFWLWIGGIFSITAITSNVYLFSVLGSIQMSILPIFGQVCTSLIIDQWGLFGAGTRPLNFFKVAGVLIALGGILVTNDAFKKVPQTKNSKRLLYQAWAVLAGALLAMQAAINGRLGSVLASSLKAAQFSFSVGAVVLFILVILRGISFKKIRPAIKQTKKDWWLWFGGILGGSYAFGTAWLVPQIGMGQLVVLVLFGQLFTSAMIEHFGLFSSPEKKISLKKILGLFILFIGVWLIKKF